MILALKTAEIANNAKHIVSTKTLRALALLILAFLETLVSILFFSSFISLSGSGWNLKAIY